ncbi:MAG: hypothetical protein OH335_04405 [Candidatus Parvarchaeota archaeon]|nr:hypothetical protein [Candidatus Jingweiarchaeum tengchongense]MCW1305988.1 hypothetical protein [Candidatus Jingweiarchaeum tengchongense]
MRKNYLPSSDNEEERLEKLKDVLKTKEDTDDDFDDLSDDDLSETSEPHTTSEVLSNAKTKKEDKNEDDNQSSIFLLSMIGQGLARARKVPDWYKDEFISAYVDFGLNMMNQLGLNMGDAIKPMKSLPTWQKYVLFGVFSAAAAFFVIQIPTHPNQDQFINSSQQQQRPTQSTRYQQKYIITPDVSMIQGMDGVVKAQNQNTPPTIATSEVLSHDGDNKAKSEIKTSEIHATSEMLSHDRDNKAKSEIKTSEIHATSEVLSHDGDNKAKSEIKTSEPHTTSEVLSHAGGES